MSRFAPSIVAAQLRAAAIGLSLVAPLAIVAPVLTPTNVHAQEQTDPLVKAVEDFWHYGKIARYELAAARATEITTGGAEPVKVLEAFERVASDRNDNIDEWLTRWQGIDQLKEPAAALSKTINEGRFTRRADPTFITTNISRLSGGDRPYRLAMIQLRESGELAIPLLLDILKDPSKPEMHGSARRAIVDLGRLGLNPLVAATESDDPGQLTTVALLLGDIGYDAAVPYLTRLVETSNVDTVKQAANQALAKLGGASAKSGNLFYDLAEKLYYSRSPLVADARFPQANVWRHESGKGLLRTPVPQSIYNDLMTMRACEYALQLGAEQDALSLWLASNYKREADLPAGETDATRQANQGDAHYYGVTAGAQYVNSALARAINDRNSAVALKAVKSLQEIVGDANYKSTGSPGPLVDAMQYGERRVRFEAAFTLAGALPQSAFAGQEMVVPLLAEAISQTGQPSVLVVMPTQEAVNAIVDPLKVEKFITAGATNAASALAAAAAVPAIDVVVISDELPAAEVETLLGMIAQSPKVRASGKLFVVKTTASQWEARKVTDRTISTTTSVEPASIKAAIATAREMTGALPLDPELATQYATRAGQLIKNLAISRGQILDLSPARSTLLGALEDARPEIIKLAGEGLALINSDDSQRGLLIKATTDGVADDVKVSLLKSVSTNAKFFGNKLADPQIASLDKVVHEATNPDVRAAAAEARGALNLPSDQAKTLILEQSRR
ncbi:MAG: HEAT repeat domain-containing protein [Burkholderiales bacterium]|nr:HEAT repeat domain-containing protein [Phycisphaerae bacterium]